MRADHDIVLSRVRARASGAESIPARLWLDRALAGTADRLPGLAPGAVLLVESVRHLAPPPSLRSADGGRESARWRDALRTLLGEAVRTAARPAGGAVPANAPAVLFADEAELLSCLTADWLAGAIAQRWWWRLLGDAGDGLAGVIALWRRLARHGPAALEILAAGGHHLRFARVLGEEQALSVADAVAAAWAMEPPSRWVSRIPPLALDPGAVGGRRPAVAPWASTAPEVTAAGLGPSQELLLGLGLSLARAPAMATSARTARRIDAWLRVAHEGVGAGSAPSLPAEAGSAASTAADAVEGSRSPEPVRAPGLKGPLPQAPASAAAAGPAQPGGSTLEAESGLPDSSAAAPTDMEASAHVPSGPVPALPDSTRSAAQEQPRRGEPPAPGDAGPVVEVLPADGPDIAIEATPRADARPAARTSAPASVKPLIRDAGAVDAMPEPRELHTAAPSPDRAPSRRAKRAPELVPPSPARAQRFREARGPDDRPDEDREDHPLSQREVIHSRLAGMLYLLNVAIAIGHYGDFGSPARPGLALSPWDWVASVTRTLMPRAPRRDPVWPLLARLAGHDPDARPGVGFRAPRVWRVPLDLLESLPTSGEPWLHSVTDGRLLVRHPLGFTVVDVPVSADPAAQLRREIARYRRASPALAPTRLGEALVPPDAYTRWVLRTTEYVGVRLRVALGTSSSAAAARLLLRRPGVIFADHERVAVRFSLSDHPLAIRVAGLDRDPGWIPATGMTVAFHFD